MKVFIATMVALVAIGVAGCGSSISVSSDYNPQADFSQFKTFRWLDVQKRPEGDPLRNPLWSTRIKNAAVAALTAKGFKEVQEGEPDFFVAAHAGLKEKMNVSDWGYTMGPYWGPYPYGRNIQTSYYTEASLVIDVISHKPADELAWRGIGTGVLGSGEGASPDELQDRSNRAVAEILYDFPPTGKK